LLRLSSPRVARFFSAQFTKTWENIQNCYYITKWPYYIQNGLRIYQPFSITRPSNIYPNLDFWFENKPSGNPDAQFGFGKWSFLEKMKLFYRLFAKSVTPHNTLLDVVNVDSRTSAL
jgi:hypothetical protein